MSDVNNIVVSGMRATGKMHLGNYHGTFKDWLKLQYHYKCFFFVADFHALTTNYINPFLIKFYAKNMVIDWLASGLKPDLSNIFVQSHIPEYLELYLLLSMIVPISWLKRVPSFKSELNDNTDLLKKDLINTYGFLGYPLLQTVDILAYNGTLVPVGLDQLSHIEFSREVVRKFNFLYGVNSKLQNSYTGVIKKIDKYNLSILEKYIYLYRSSFNKKFLKKIINLSKSIVSLTSFDRENLLKYVMRKQINIFSEPKPLLSSIPKLLGLDGRKMSKSYNNTILLTDSNDILNIKVKKMKTDSARVYIHDKGNPDKCPVWGLHVIYTSLNKQIYLKDMCVNGTGGCLECKKVLIENLIKHHTPIRKIAQEYHKNIDFVDEILKTGANNARENVLHSLKKVKEIINFSF